MSTNPTNQLASEFFRIEIKNVQPNGRIWTDRGSGADQCVAFWKVEPSPGFYSLGHFATNFYDIDENDGRPAPVTITLSPKPGYENLLGIPLDYEKIWDDAGSDADDDVAIWRMVCPSGYVSLGDVATNGDKPSNDSFRCIKQTATNAEGKTVSLVTRAAFRNFAQEGETGVKAFWTDAGSGADNSASVWLMHTNQRPANRNQVYLAAGTFRANPYHNAPPAQSGYALVLDFPESDVMERVDLGNSKVKLKGPSLPSKQEMAASQVEQRYTLPFFAVQDPNYNSQLAQFRDSPTYQVVRTTIYEAIDSYEPINTETKEYSVMIGKSEETNYNNEVGVALGLSVEVGGEAGMAVASTSVKVTASVELSYSHSWGGATSFYEEKSFNYPQTVTGGCFGVLFQAKSTYVIYRQDGTMVGAPMEVNTNQFYTDEWVPEGKLPEASAEKTDKPNTITFTIDAPPGKVIILEGRLEIRDGQLLSAPTVSTLALLAPPGNSIVFKNIDDAVMMDNKLSKSYTKEAWVKIAADNIAGNNIVSGGENVGRHAFWVKNRKVCSGHNDLWEAVQCAVPMSQDWAHYAVTYDDARQEMILYKNGEQVSVAQNVPSYSDGNQINIGKYGPNHNFFTGEMAEVRVWNSARTAEQIKTQMNTVLPKATAGLITRYPVGG